MKVSRGENIPKLWILLFGGCFLLGILGTNFWKTDLIDKSGFLGEYMLLCMKQVQINYGEYFWFLVRRRIGEAIFLAVISSTYLGLIGIYLYISWAGFATGIFLAGAGIRYGTKGILLFLGSMMPHQLLLIPCGIFFVYWCYRMCMALYYPDLCKEPYYGSKKQFLIRKFIQFQIILGVVIIGCLMECYVNPYIVTKLLNFF
ncbi:MAG: stage II sporulation protein M [Lachnospiraceae bacterium]|nr:stage II sporulation protein M [Lachnospiraceae bacterium]